MRFHLYQLAMAFQRFKRKKNVEEKKDGAPVVNKKVIGAKKVIFDGIEFKSKFEGSCYLLLKESNLNFEHESEQCLLWPGFKDTNLYLWKRKGEVFERKVMPAARDWTYTPDFVIVSKDGMTKIYVEAKGNPTDLTPYKTKVFMGYLSKLSKVNGKSYEYAFVKNLKEMKYLIEELKKDDKYLR